MFTNKSLARLLAVALIAVACTDLTETVDDGIGLEVVEGTPPGITDPAAALTGVYAHLNNMRGAGGSFALMQHPSDEMMGPTRGTDWSDFGVWRQLHAHTWDPSHTQILNAWNHLNEGVFRATQVAEASNADGRQVAEAQFLRALYAFYIMDLFGQVPYRAVDAQTDDLPEVMDRAAAFDWIVADLTAARPELPSLASGSRPGTASQEAVDFLLAKLYLNRAVYLGSMPENPSAGPYTFESADMDEVIARVDQIMAGGYPALTEYFDNFHWNNSERSNELIFVRSATLGSPGNFTHFAWTLHYNHSPTSCCNGFTTLSDFYDLFTDNDVRKGAYIPEMSASTGVLAGFLVGQQYDSFDGPDNPGNPLSDRGGNPLVFTPDVDLFYSDERRGIRVIKYLINPANPSEPGTDFIFFRYADALLMKAEAHLRKGETGPALQIVNEIRTHRGADALQNLTEQDLLDERGRELYWEGWRRNDLIRFGEFTGEWDQKETSPDFRVLFPIPQRALDTNPNLVQTSGY
jgi:starch-binding outer membrane protein, SusD/RagB family